MFEARPAVKANASDPDNGEFNRQGVASPAVRIVGWRTVDGPDMTIRKGRRIKNGRFFGIAFIPQALR